MAFLLDGEGTDGEISGALIIHHLRDIYARLDADKKRTRAKRNVETRDLSLE